MSCDLIEYDPCAAPSNLVAAFLSRLAHSYQEGTNITALLTALLSEVEEYEGIVCGLVDTLDCDTAVGDQLDIVGTIVGLPRTVCGVFRSEPQLCGGPVIPLEDYTFTDDAEYRKFIKAHIAARNFDGTLAAYESILQLLFDDIPIGDPLTGDARVAISHGGYTFIRIPRALTDLENQRMELVKFILPYFGATDVRVGFGTGTFALGDDALTGVCQTFPEVI